MGTAKFTVNRFFFYFKRQIWKEGAVSFREHPTHYCAQRLYMVFKGLFVENHWGYSAQLAFNTMMAIVPVFAVIFAIGRGFGFEEYIAQWCRTVFVSQPMVADAILTLAGSYIKYTQTGVIVGISLVFMLYSVISLFDNVETVFNGIWAVKKERSLGKAAVDYLSIIFLVPLAIVLFSGLGIFSSSLLDRLPEFQVITPLFKGTLGFAVQCAVITVFFTLMYVFVPNTKVRLPMVWFPALLAALCILGLQSVYIHYQILFSSYSLIYGSLAALPLFMLWMQLSWFICIGFAELGRANQELSDGHLGEDRRESHMERMRKSAVVLGLLVRRQQRGGGPCGAPELLRTTHYSHAQLLRSLTTLVDAHLVARTHGDDGEELYTLNHNTGQLTAGFMVSAILGRKKARRKTDNGLGIAAGAEREMEAILDEALKRLGEIPVADVPER